jgi:two-component system, cell cycle response regulator DivK
VTSDTPAGRLAPSVLLVNDSDDEREMYAEYFSISGFRTLQTHDADEAYRLAVEFTPDVVVTVMRFAGRSHGLALTRSLKADEATQRIPVVILTREALEQDRRIAAAAGCDRCMEIPLMPEALGAAVQQVLARGVAT